MSADRFENSLGVFASLCEAAGAGPPYMDAKPSPAKLAKGEDLCDAILGVRGEMARSKSNRQVTAAPPPASEIRAMVRAEPERRRAEAFSATRFKRDATGNERFSSHAPDMQPWQSRAAAEGPGRAWMPPVGCQGRAVSCF